MASLVWIASDGYWNDPLSWGSGYVPGVQDVALFPVSANVTVEGSAYVGQMLLRGGSVDVSGDLSSDGSDEASLSDDGATSNGSSLSIESWGSLTLDDLSLTSYSFADTGLVLTQAATIKGGAVAGEGAEWVSGNNALIEGTLSVSGGASLLGSFTLGPGAELVTDGQSTIAGGMLSVVQSATLFFNTSSSTTYVSPQAVADGIYLAENASLTIVSGNGQPVEIQGGVYGTGTISIIGANLVIGLAGEKEMVSQDVVFPLPQVRSQSETLSTQALTFELTSSVLDLRSQPLEASETEVVHCSGDADAVFGGSQSLLVESSGANLIDVQAGGGANTVAAGGAVLTYSQGTGSADVTCGSSGHDSVQVGAGESIVQASDGSKIQIVGSGPTTVTGGSGTAFLDDRSGSGDVMVYGDVGTGITSVAAGAGAVTVQGESGALSVQGGTGSLTVWGGTSGRDTLEGGTGANTVVGGAGALVVAHGSVSGLYGGGSNATVDGSASSANNTIFADPGSSDTRLIGGSGSDVFLGGTGTVYVQGGAGSSVVWAGTGTGDTIVGGGGNNTLQGGASATIKLNGAGKNLVLSADGGTLIDRQEASGADLVFASGAGDTSIVGGLGFLTAVINQTNLDVQTEAGGSLLWCMNNAHVVLSGAGTTTVVTAGQNCNVDDSACSGTGTFFIGQGAQIELGSGNNHVIAGQSAATVTAGGGFNTIFGGDGSLQIDVLTQSAMDGSLLVLGFDPSKDNLSFGSGASVSSAVSPWGVVLTSNHEQVVLYNYFGGVNLG
jgi:Ca2+-binding RTX toxin-like protein